MRRILSPVALGALALGAVACSGDSSTVATTTTPGQTASAGLDGIQTLLSLRHAGAWRADGVDDIEVWICHVPVDTTAPMYFGLPLRLPLTTAGVVEVLNARVTTYYDTISNGLYHPQFHSGGEANLGISQDPHVCVDQAIIGAEDTADAVLVVADAEHVPGFRGGFGTGGQPCPFEPPCPVLNSRRSAYVGASDFNSVWGAEPPMDLVEHEIGHTLGWAHSGFVDGAQYQSALDLMSNNAAPREIDPARRDGPDTLAINRLLAGWLPESDVWVAPPRGGMVHLEPSTSDGGTRLAFVVLSTGVGNASYLTVEVLSSDGYNAHLPAGGVAVHRVEVTLWEVQANVPLVGAAPFTDLLQPGEFVESDGWRIEALEGGVSITPVP